MIHWKLIHRRGGQANKDSTQSYNLENKKVSVESSGAPEVSIREGNPLKTVGIEQKGATKILENVSLSFAAEESSSNQTTKNLHNAITLENNVKSVESKTNQSFQKSKAALENHQQGFQKLRSLIFNRGIRIPKKGAPRTSSRSTLTLKSPFSHWQDERISLFNFFGNYCSLGSNSQALSNKLSAIIKEVQTTATHNNNLNNDCKKIINSLNKLKWTSGYVELLPTQVSRWRDGNWWGWNKFALSPFSALSSQENGWKEMMKSMQDAQDLYDSAARNPKCSLFKICVEANRMKSSLYLAKERVALEIAGSILDKMNQSS